MGSGLFHALTRLEQRSLLEMARRELMASIRRQWDVRAKHDAYWARKRGEARDAALKKLLEIYIDAAYYFEMYHSEACAKTAAALKADLKWLKENRGEARQLAYLKDQILIRVVGFGWGEFKVNRCRYQHIAIQSTLACQHPSNPCTILMCCAV